MNILEAFQELDKSMTESASTDEFKQLLMEINRLDKEIKELQSKKQSEWTTTYSKKFEKEAKELAQLKKDLQELRNSYREYSHTERERDDDRYFYYDVYVDNADKKAAVAEHEAELTTKLAELESKYQEIVNSIKAEAEADDTNTALKTKSTTLGTKNERKAAILKKIIEEERPELEELVKKINTVTTVTADFNSLSAGNGTLIFRFTSTPFTYEIDYDRIDVDDGEATINTSGIEDALNEDVFENGFLYDVGYSLDLPEDEIENWDEGEAIEIPGSTWKLWKVYDISYDEPEVHSYSSGRATYWEPDWDDIDYDEEINWTVTCFLVKDF
jgi:hypothetical protein